MLPSVCSGTNSLAANTPECCVMCYYQHKTFIFGAAIQEGAQLTEGRLVQ